MRRSQLRFTVRWLIFAASIIGVDVAAINWLVTAKSATADSELAIYTYSLRPLHTIRESLPPSVDGIADPRRPTWPVPTHPGPDHPTPARNRPTGSNPPGANKPTQLGGTAPGAGRPGATNSKGSDHTTADAPARPPTLESPRWTLAQRSTARPGQLGRMEATSGRVMRDPQPTGNRVQAPTVPLSESATEKPIGHRNLETRPGEPTGRSNPTIRDRSLDERVPEDNAGRPSPSLEIANRSRPGAGVDPNPKHRPQEGELAPSYSFKDKKKNKS